MGVGASDVGIVGAAAGAEPADPGGDGDTEAGEDVAAVDDGAVDDDTVAAAVDTVALDGHGAFASGGAVAPSQYLTTKARVIPAGTPGTEEVVNC
jgi:hypothetical protein